MNTPYWVENLSIAFVARCVGRPGPCHSPLAQRAHKAGGSTGGRIILGGPIVIYSKITVRTIFNSARFIFISRYFYKIYIALDTRAPLVNPKT